MARQYVRSPKTGRVIEVGARTYNQVSKNAAYKQKLTRSPKSFSKKSFSKKKLIKSPKRGRRRAPVKCGEECFLGDNMTFAVCDTECNHSPLRPKVNEAYYNRIAQRVLALKEKPPVNPDWGDDFKHNYSPFNKTDLDLGGGGPRREPIFNLIQKREKEGTCYKGQNCPVDSNTWENVAYSFCKNIGKPHGFGSWKGDSTMSCANF